MRRGGAAVLAIMLTAMPGRVARTSAAAPARDESSLAARAARFPAIRSARADFTQERVVSLMDEVLRATGTLTLTAPASMRLVLAAPERMTLAADGGTVTVSDAAGRALPLPAEASGLAAFARTLTALLLGGERPERFDERWEGPDAVTLTPRDPATPFVTIALRFSPTAPLPEEIVLHERGGDRTTIRLSAVQVSAEPQNGDAAR